MTYKVYRRKPSYANASDSENEREQLYEEIAAARHRRFGAMRPTAMDFFGDIDDQGSAMAMDVDDVDPLDMFGEGVIGESKLADADFFNSFQDDFDDTDIN